MVVFRKLSSAFVIAVMFLSCSSDDIEPGCFQEENRISRQRKKLEGAPPTASEVLT